jgi:acyl-CoA thioester hydrolase
MEVGRVELMRAAGLSYARLEAEGTSLPLIGLELRYRAPARFDDVVEIETALESCGRARLRFAYRLVRVTDGRLLATGATEHAAVDRSLRPVRVPEPLRRVLTDGRVLPPAEGPC